MLFPLLQVGWLSFILPFHCWDWELLTGPLLFVGSVACLHSLCRILHRKCFNIDGTWFIGSPFTEFLSTLSTRLFLIRCWLAYRLSVPLAQSPGLHFICIRIYNYLRSNWHEISNSLWLRKENFKCGYPPLYCINHVKFPCLTSFCI